MISWAATPFRAFISLRTRALGILVVGGVEACDRFVPICCVRSDRLNQSGRNRFYTPNGELVNTEDRRAPLAEIKRAMEVSLIVSLPSYFHSLQGLGNVHPPQNHPLKPTPLVRVIPLRPYLLRCLPHRFGLQHPSLSCKTRQNSFCRRRSGRNRRPF